MGMLAYGTGMALPEIILIIIAVKRKKAGKTYHGLFIAAAVVCVLTTAGALLEKFAQKMTAGAATPLGADELCGLILAWVVCIIGAIILFKKN